MRSTTSWPSPLGVFIHPRAYGAAFYALLSLAAGTLAFSWVATGLSLSLGLLPLIIGPLVAVGFLIASRLFGRFEQRVLELLTGEATEAPLAVWPVEGTFLHRCGQVFTDGATWRALLFLALRLPLGIVGFTAIVTGSALGAALVAAPGIRYFQNPVLVEWGNHTHTMGYPEAFLYSAIGIVILAATLHGALLFVRLQGWLGRKLLG